MRSTARLQSWFGQALKTVEVLIRFHPSVLRLCKLMLLMLCTCHWMGCTWWFVADLELTASGNYTDAASDPNEWQPRAELLSSHLGAQFAAAFVWGTSQHSTTQDQASRV